MLTRTAFVMHHMTLLDSYAANEAGLGLFQALEDVKSAATRRAYLGLVLRFLPGGF